MNFSGQFLSENVALLREFALQVGCLWCNCIFCALDPRQCVSPKKLTKRTCKLVLKWHNNACSRSNFLRIAYLLGLLRFASFLLSQISMRTLNKLHYFLLNLRQKKCHSKNLTRLSNDLDAGLLHLKSASRCADWVARKKSLLSLKFINICFFCLSSSRF